MRRLLTIAVIAVLLATGCARLLPRDPQAMPTQAGAIPASHSATETRQAEVYEQVLRRYLNTPAENSFPAETFETAYVLDSVRSDAGNPIGDTHTGDPIPSDVKARITASLAQTVSITFISNKGSVLETSNGCATVRNRGILITLGTIDGDDDQVTVGINGYVACLGATWLTYLVRNQPGTGWNVTGTTGPIAMA
jgi:hypothetical protein